MSDSNILKFERRNTPPPPDDFDTRRALDVCEQMLSALSNPALDFTIAAACGTHFLIHIHDLAQRAKAIGRTLTFNDDVDLINGITNITDLISKLRNAVCHIRSPSRKFGEASFVFGRIVGYMPNGIKFENYTQGCNYPDDVALYYGEYRFYLRRHGTRAIAELRNIFSVK